MKSLCVGEPTSLYDTEQTLFSYFQQPPASDPLWPYFSQVAGQVSTLLNLIKEPCQLVHILTNSIRPKSSPTLLRFI